MGLLNPYLLLGVTLKVVWKLTKAYHQFSLIFIQIKVEKKKI